MTKKDNQQYINDVNANSNVGVRVSVYYIYMLNDNGYSHFLKIIHVQGSNLIDFYEPNKKNYPVHIL